MSKKGQTETRNEYDDNLNWKYATFGLWRLFHGKKKQSRGLKWNLTPHLTRRLLSVCPAGPAGIVGACVIRDLPLRIHVRGGCTLVSRRKETKLPSEDVAVFMQNHGCPLTSNQRALALTLSREFLIK